MEKTSEKNKLKLSHVLFYFGMVLIGVAIILAIVFWLKGETKTYGEFPDPETSISLNCEAVGYSYPFFTYDEARKRTIEINSVFNNGELSKISLAYTLNYDDQGKITESEAVNHAAMNKEFANDELGQDLFGSSYAKLSDGVKYTIAADADDIYKGGGAKYFLLSEAGDPPYSAKTVKEVYQEKGIKCEQK